MKISIRETESISLVLGILTTLILSWFYLLNYIIELTTNDPSNILLFSLTLFHYFIFILIINSSILVFIEGLNHLKIYPENLKRANSISERHRNTLFKYWLPIFITSILIIAFTNFSGVLGKNMFVDVFNLVAPVLLSFLFLFYLMGKKVVYVYIHKIKMWTMFFLFVFYFVYIILMATSFATVKINTDKSFYRKGEPIQFSVYRQGYFFLPFINRIHLSGVDVFTNTGWFPKSFSINPSEMKFGFINSNSFLMVEFKPQLISIKKEVYFPLNVSNN